MIEQALHVEVDEKTVLKGVLHRPEDCRPRRTPGVILAHGRQTDLDHPLLVTVARGLAERGVASVLRFNFPYAEAGRSSPDPLPRLEEAYRRAHDLLADDAVCPPGRLFLAGKSMGARVAAGLVSRRDEGEGLLAAGLIFLGYPLHAPGREPNLETLRLLSAPALFVQGSRDPFCRLDVLRPLLPKLPVGSRLFVVQGGGHSYELPRTAGKTIEQVHEEILAEIASFIRDL